MKKRKLRIGVWLLRFLHPTGEKERMELRYDLARSQATAADLARMTRRIVTIHEAVDMDRRIYPTRRDDIPRRQNELDTAT